MTNSKLQRSRDYESKKS